MHEHKTSPEVENHDQNYLSTEEFALFNKVRPQTVRIRLCTTGSYFGITPVKLKNNRLAWPRVLAV
jgi:hypothetical protein